MACLQLLKATTESLTRVKVCKPSQEGLQVVFWMPNEAWQGELICDCRAVYAAVYELYGAVK